MYLTGEQRKSRMQLELKDPLEQRDTKNPFLHQLRCAMNWETFSTSNNLMHLAFMCMA